MKIKDFIDYEQPNEYIVESDRYSSKYSTPVLTAGLSFILGYTNESKGIYEKGPCIIFDDFTTSVHYVDFPFKVKSSAMKILTTKSNADLKYCYYLLLSVSKMPPNHKRQWISTTSEKNHVLPSMDRQISIVKQLDLISNTIANYTNQIENLDNLVKARFVEMFGDPEENPFNWEKTLLTKVIINANNGMARRGNDKDGNIVMRLVELQDGYIDYSNPNRIILKDNEKKRYLLKDKDFLFARVNGNPDNVGRCAVFHDIGEDVYHNDQIIRVHFDVELLNGTFASALFNSDYGKKQLKSQIKTSAGQYTVSQDGIGAIATILPPAKLQNQFADFVHQVDKSKLAVQKSLDKTQQLFDSLMQEYFG